MRPQSILTSEFLKLGQKQQKASLFSLQVVEKKYDWLPYLYAIIGNISWVFLQINVKILSSYISPLHALAIRGFFYLRLTVLFSRILNKIQALKIDIVFFILTKSIKFIVFKLLLIRIALSCAGVSMFLGSVMYIPLGTANALFNVGPIIVCFIQAWKYQVHFILTCVCFIGVLMVIQPEFIFGVDNDVDSVSKTSKIFMIFCLISACSYAYSNVILFELKGKVSPTIALEYFYIGQALFNSLAMTFQQNNLDQIRVDHKFLLSIAGLVFFAYATQNLTTRAMLLKKPSYIMPFGYITLVVSALVDKIFFGSQFGLLMVVGMFLTSSGLLVKLLVPEDIQIGQKKEIKDGK